MVTISVVFWWCFSAMCIVEHLCNGIVLCTHDSYAGIVLARKVFTMFSWCILLCCYGVMLNHSDSKTLLYYIYTHVSGMNTLFVVKHIYLTIHKNVDKNFNKNYTTKIFQKIIDKICFQFNKNFYKNFNQNSDKNLGKNECLNKNFYKILNQKSDKNYGRSEICSYKGILCDILFVVTQNLTKLSIIFCRIYVSTVNYIHLLKKCHEKILKISYIKNSATYLTAFLLFAQISETKFLKKYPFILYAVQLYLYLFKVNLSKHYKLFKKLLSSNNFIFYHGS